MAEFIVFNVDGITLTQVEVNERITRDANYQKKYNARNQKGDIIEARVNGFGMAGKEPEHFALIKVPDLDIKTAKDYVGSRYEEVVETYDFPKAKYTEENAEKYFNRSVSVKKEYKVPTDVPILGTVDIDWVELEGVVDKMDRRSKWYLNMGSIILDKEKTATLTLTQFNNLLGEK